MTCVLAKDSQSLAGSLLAVALMCSALLPAFVYAQSGLRGIENTVFISYTPTNPQSGDTVTFTAKSSSIDIAESAVSWTVNGKAVTGNAADTSVQATLGALGTETTVAAVATTPDGVVAEAQAVIVPSELDLLVDSDSYTPPFYAGRARASAGTNVRLQAVPRFRYGGKLVPASELTFTWRKNGDPLGSISGRGRTTAVIPVQHLFGSDTISVEVRTSDGRVSNTASFSVPSAEPFIALYEDHPLYGVMYHRQLRAANLIPETEMTFTAVPFFAQASGPRDPQLAYAWRVNGADVASHPTDPEKITINASNSTGRALVELNVSHASNYFLDAKGAWNITFSTGETVIDQFHTSEQ